MTPAKRQLNQTEATMKKSILITGCSSGIGHCAAHLLQERGWIEIIGQRDSIGKPALWATTEQFLSDLQLTSLAELPPLTELGELILPEIPQLFGESEDASSASEPEPV